MILYKYEVLKYYKFSKYVVDPNKQGPKRWLGSLYLCLDSQEATKEIYLFKMETSEVKEFVKENEYQNISLQRDGILYYKGRILATEKINASYKMSTVMKDLCLNTFRVL